MIREILGPEISDVVTNLIETCEEIYLVGGSIRDHLLEIPSHDLDFVVKRNALKAAKISADKLGGHYYALDAERGTGRALVEIKGESIILDFATMASEGIQVDLELRDFTINAIAVNIADPKDLFDPLHGAQDLRAGLLRPCSPASFANDPIRTIRAVRFQQRLKLTLDQSAEVLIQAAAPGLSGISAERKRDELFAVFESDNIKQSCELMQSYKIWDQVFPYLPELDRLQDIPRHFHSLKEHTLYVLGYCQQLLEHINGSDIVPENEYVISAWESLDEFQSDLTEYFSRPPHPQRQYDGLLYLAILYHDLSKVEITPVEVSGKIGFPGHAEKSADLFDQTRSNWALSKEEFQFIDRLIRNHMLPEGINGTDEVNSRRVLYRFFQRSGSAGVLIGIFHLADILATYEDTITPERWKKALNTCRTLLECWFRKYNQIVAPPALLSGDEVMRDFGLAPGPQIGKLLEDVQEGQAAGIINNKEMACKHILCLLDRREDKR
jgi:tRNA nucleotidyltransferase/poly(A) polymerase